MIRQRVRLQFAVALCEDPVHDDGGRILIGFAGLFGGCVLLLRHFAGTAFLFIMAGVPVGGASLVPLVHLRKLFKHILELARYSHSHLGRLEWPLGRVEDQEFPLLTLLHLLAIFEFQSLIVATSHISYHLLCLCEELITALFFEQGDDLLFTCVAPDRYLLEQTVSEELYE